MRAHHDGDIRFPQTLERTSDCHDRRSIGLYVNDFDTLAYQPAHLGRQIRGLNFCIYDFHDLGDLRIILCKLFHALSDIDVGWGSFR